MAVDYQKYLASEEWAKVRVDIVAVRGNKCEICGKRGSQVHHRTYDNLGCEEPEDLILTCGKCHMKEHGLIKTKKSKKVTGGKPKKGSKKARNKKQKRAIALSYNPVKVFSKEEIAEYAKTHPRNGS